MRWVVALSTSALIVATSFVACSSTTPAPSNDQDAAADVPDAKGEANDAPADVSTDAASCTLPGRFGSEVCETCLRAKCCTPILACDSDVPCKTILDCARACLLKPNATPCIEKCVQDTPAGQGKYKAFDDCIAAPPDGGGGGCAFACSG